MFYYEMGLLCKRCVYTYTSHKRSKLFNTFDLNGWKQENDKNVENKEEQSSTNCGDVNGKRDFYL